MTAENVPEQRRNALRADESVSLNIFLSEMISRANERLNYPQAQGKLSSEDCAFIVDETVATLTAEARTIVQRLFRERPDIAMAELRNYFSFIEEQALRYVRQEQNDFRDKFLQLLDRASGGRLSRPAGRKASAAAQMLQYLQRTHGRSRT